MVRFPRGYEDLVERGAQREFRGHAELEEVEQVVGKPVQLWNDGIIDHFFDVLVEVADGEGVRSLHQNVQTDGRGPDIRGKTRHVEALPVLREHELLLPGEVEPQPAEGVVLEAGQEGEPAEFDFATDQGNGETPPGRAEQDVVRTDVEVAELARVHYVKGETGKPRSRRVRNTCHMM